MTIPSLDERISGAIRNGRTDARIWSELPHDKSDKWSFRAERAAQIINGLGGVRSVLDLGCFRMSLEHHLAATIAYIPSDLVRRDARTIVCDLNAEPPPSVDADLVSALGVLEHLKAPADVMRRLAGSYPLAVVSYNPLDLVPIGKARRHFLNDMSRDEATSLFSADWEIVSEEPLGHQVLWLLLSRDDAVRGKAPALLLARSARQETIRPAELSD